MFGHLPQTPQAGEFSALAAAGVNLADPACIYSDCASVVSVCSRDPVDRLSGKRAYAGSVLECFSGASGKIQDVIKVAAHKDVDDPDITDVERFRRKGNFHADLAAKKGAGLHPRPEPDVQDRIDFHIRASKAVIKLACKLLPLWPKCDLSEVEYVKPPAKLPADHRSHDWEWVSSFWQCRVCLRGKRGADRPPPGRCTKPPRLNIDLISGNNHQCALLDCTDGSFLCICLKCHHYSTGGRIVHLAKPCVPDEGGAGRTN